MARHLRLVVEYDGWYWHQGQAELDSRKAQALESHGWLVVRIRESSGGQVLPDIDGVVCVTCTDREDPQVVSERVLAVVRPLVAARQSVGSLSVRAVHGGGEDREVGAACASGVGVSA